MQVSVETGEGLERKLTVQIPAETVEKEVESRLKSMSGRVRIDGFRPGKVPMKVVKQQYGQSVQQEVVGELMQSSFQDAVVQEDLKLAGNPSIEPKTMGMGEALEYVATFEVYPDVTLGDLSALEIERVQASIDDSDVDEMIETLRKQRTTYEVVERASADGDQVTISFEGFMDGEAFEGGKADSVPMVLGSGSMIPGFEEALIGKSAGDEFTFEVTFPDDYHVDDLKGKPAKFETKVISVAEAKTPEVDEDFVKSFGVESGDVEQLRKDISENMERELRNKLQSILKTNVMDALLEAHPIDVPASLVDEECETLQKQMSEAGQLQGGMSLPKELFEPQAKKRVSLGMIVAEVIKKAEIRPDADKVKAKIEDVAATYEDPQEVINHYQNNPQLTQGIEGLVLEDMMVEWVAEQAKITEVVEKFAEIMKPENTQA